MYTNLSQTGKEIYFYTKLETISLINVFIYFIMTKNTRKMILKFLGKEKKQEMVVVSGSQQNMSSRGPISSFVA
uniref:G_PROTEIN_RECEP_F1_2 domain-containing protein n=1 Tax=Caenorhabditis tropicalis TaxID=1561998 RepID=A0A1I7TRR8_9PELO